MSDVYYMIHITTANSPSVRHTNLSEARAEARRLAEKYPGVPVHVLFNVETYYAKPSVAHRLKLRYFGAMTSEPVVVPEAPCDVA